MARSKGPNKAMTSPITVAVTFALTIPPYAGAGLVTSVDYIPCARPSL
jgi:hypothetical protein